MSATKQLPPAPALPATIGAILAADPAALELLESFGIRLDPFTIIALRCTPEELAEYSALRDRGELRAALERRGEAAGRKRNGA